MRPATSLAAAICLGLGATPAAADWQYSQWGMSPAQVEAASGGAAKPNDERDLDAEGLRAELAAPYMAGSLPFTAVFRFDAEDMLDDVALIPTGPVSCPVVRATLIDHHGTPEGKADPQSAPTLRWHDLDANNLVVFLDLGGGHCSIQYSKLPNTRPNGGGL